MVFDDRISTTVSMSRILDVFLEDNEKPSTILYFLKEHEDRFLDIVKFSDHSPRLFSLDFLGRCNPVERNLLESLLPEENAGNEEIDRFIWSIFFCNGVPNNIKKIFGKHLDRLRDRGMAVHPHSGRIGKSIREIDKVLCEYPYEPFDYANAINNLDCNRIVEWSRNFRRSLYAFRVFQCDVFSSIDPIRQFLLLNNLEVDYAFPMHKCMKQLLQSNVHSDIKRKICEIVHNDDYAGIYSGIFGVFYGTELERIIVDEIDSEKGFNSLCMKILVSGHDIYMDWILYLTLVRRGLSFIGKSSESNLSLMDEHLGLKEVLAGEKLA